MVAQTRRAISFLQGGFLEQVLHKDMRWLWGAEGTEAHNNVTGLAFHLCILSGRIEWFATIKRNSCFMQNTFRCPRAFKIHYFQKYLLTTCFALGFTQSNGFGLLQVPHKEGCDGLESAANNSSKCPLTNCMNLNYLVPSGLCEMRRQIEQMVPWFVSVPGSK